MICFPKLNIEYLHLTPLKIRKQKQSHGTTILKKIMGKMKSNNAEAVKKKVPKNRSTKTSIEFNAEKRKEFLCGFRKRKNERRKKAKEELKNEIKNQKKKAKELAREEAKKNRGEGKANQIIPEIEHLLVGKEQKTEFSGATVTVQAMDLNSATKTEIKPDEEESEENSGSSGLRKSELKAVNRMVQKKMAKLAKQTKTSNSKKMGKKTAKSKRDRHHHPKKIKD